MQKAFHDETFEVESLLEYKVLNGVLSVLVKWSGFSEADNSCESIHVIQHYPPGIVSDFEKEMNNGFNFQDTGQREIKRRIRRESQALSGFFRSFGE